MRPLLRLFSFLLIIASISGCSIVSRTTNGLSQSVLEQEDPQLISESLPTLIVIMDGLINASPYNENLLFAGAQLYGAYSGFFVNEPERKKAMSEKALAYAKRGLCETLGDLCEALEAPENVFLEELNDIDDEDDLPALMGFGGTWAGWLQNNAGDWNALTALPRIRQIIEKAVEIDEGYDNAIGHVYLGVLNSQLPPALGGKPEVGRAHFERAIELTDGRSLLAKVLFAQTYTRLMFDQELHDQLLNEVLAANPKANGLTLMNTLAQKLAAELLASGADYF